MPEHRPSSCVRQNLKYIGPWQDSYLWKRDLVYLYQIVVLPEGTVVIICFFGKWRLFHSLPFTCFAKLQLVRGSSVPARDVPAVKQPKLQESEMYKTDAAQPCFTMFGSAAAAPTHSTGFSRKNSVSASPHYIVSIRVFTCQSRMFKNKLVTSAHFIST